MTLNPDDTTSGGSNHPGASGANGQPGGDGQNDQKPNNIDAILAKNKELLDEKRKLKEKLEAFEREKKEADEKSLKDRQEWQKIAEIREAEKIELATKLKAQESQESDRRKLASFLDTIDGKVDRKYWGLIDIESIAINPDSGEVDPASVAKAVDDFKKTHPILVLKQSGAGQPYQQPQGSGASLSYDEWLKLPAKEMAARMKEVRAAEK